MKIIFVQDVPQVAYTGEVKHVADGYAKNYLLPQKLAVPATSATLQSLEAQIKASAERRARAEANMTGWAQMLEGMALTFKARVGAQERLYGSITNAHIAEELQKVTGRQFDKRRVDLPAPLRKLGTHEVVLRLSKNLTPKIKVVIEEEKTEKAETAAAVEKVSEKEEPENVSGEATTA
ncbi:MAG: 50S ribosomal protein L9 [Chloroflexi bacterium]|nr:50S ribosomal protein L9 [Chloroflexota bacterium]